MKPLRLDYGNLMKPRVTDGVDAEQLTGTLAARFAEAHARVEGSRAAGTLGFLDLPYATEAVERARELADGYAQWFEDVVVLGIGGSGLGARALKEALLGPYWNELTAEDRDHFPRLHVVDNPDPYTFRALLQRVDPARTMFNVVSKSGATAETMAQYLVARGCVEEAVGPDKARGHFLFTTDPRQGALRAIGEAEDVPMLSIPENVGGRFSVLSAVGLFPAAVCGVDPRSLLDGAAAMEERCRSGVLAENPAGVLAVLLHHADTALRRSIHVLMPYADRLRPVASWFQQLWSESLGKARSLDGTFRPTGPTPIAAVGATDQHSMLQLFMEGPHDKVVVFIQVDDAEAVVDIPGLHDDVPSLSYLGGSSLGALLDNERLATAEALRLEGRPNATIHLPRVGPEELGQLFLLLELATVYAGALYDVDPLDQPGVELGKRLTYGLMGKEGAERPDIADVDPRWVL